MKKLKGFGNLEAVIRANVSKAITDAANAIASKAKQLAPKESGELAASIDVVQVDDLHVKVKTDSGHAAIEELGGHNRTAHPFLRPAYDHQEDKAIDAIVKAVNKAL